MPDFDVIVVGGGPAGSACARFLGEKGVSVLLLDKASFPRDKVCGDGMSGKSMRILYELGVKEKIESKPHSKIRGVTFSSPNGKTLEVKIPLKEGKEQYAYCARREVFDNILFEHATKVCQFRERVQVMGLQREHAKVVGVKVNDLGLDEERVITSHIVVGADGAQSIVAKELNVSHLPEEHGCVAVRGYYENVQGVKDHIELHFVEEMIPGYFWIFPIEGNKCNVGAGMVLNEMQKKKINLVDATKKVLEREPFKSRFANAKALGEMKGWTLPFGSYRRKLAFDGALLAGDAASLVDPFTGEGIGNALVSGKLAAEMCALALEKKDFSEAFLQQYENKVWEMLGEELDVSYKLQKWGKYKPLLNLFFSKAQSNPKLAALLSEMLVNETPRKKLVSPLALLKFFLS